MAAESRRAQYAARKARARDRQAEQVQAGQEVGPLPPVKDPDRRARCASNFRLFCETYLPARFPLAWSKDHLTAISSIEQTVLYGGNIAIVMPRGTGKTSLLEAGLLWGTLYGVHQMIGGLAATKGKSYEMMESFAIALETNEMIVQDFPEVCVPIRKLEGTANRAAGQTYLGQRTRIHWTKDVIVLPYIAGSPAAGAIMKVGGLTGGGVRGMKHNRPDGSVARPSCVLIDDPQTDATARSLTQNNNRENLLAGAVLGMGGPDRKMSALMATTIIEPGDMADRMTDGEKHPEWNGLRCKMIYTLPSDTSLWEKYEIILRTGLRRGDKGAAATEFYRHRQGAMDAGADVAWPQRYDEDEVSAIQHAMNLKILRPVFFWTECQGEPAAAKPSSQWATAEMIAKRTNGLKRGAVPVACNHITMYMDVHDNLLYWAVCAWQDDYTGYVIDYDAYPRQASRYFALNSAKKTLGRACQGAGRDGAIYAGLKAVCAEQLPRVFKRDDGAELRIGLAMIDANWGDTTALVHKFIREYPTANLYPCKGVGLTAASAPWDDRANKPGERSGDHCRISPTPNRTARGRHIVIDTNEWKTRAQRGLVTAPGDRGAITLFGSDPDSRVKGDELHRLFSEHLAAETAHDTMDVKRQRALIEWRNDRRGDNHWFDCLVGCAVLASLLGASSIPDSLRPPAPPRPQASQAANTVRYI